MTLVVDQVCKRASPAARDWEQLIREEGVAQRLVKVFRRGRVTNPLCGESVDVPMQRAAHAIDLLAGGSDGEDRLRSSLAVHPSVSVSYKEATEFEGDWG